MTWELVLAYPLARDLVEGDAVVIAAVGRRPHSSGGGRGRRDLNFGFDAREEAIAAGRRAMAALEREGMRTLRCHVHDDAVSIREGWEAV